uniref:Uncharacterized protein n=2 Tax=Brassica oleracea TaxID=3712 RepID=A0A0D3CE13_BRAOL
MERLNRGKGMLIWLLLASFSVAGLVLFMVQHCHQQQDPSQLTLVLC